MAYKIQVFIALTFMVVFHYASSNNHTQHPLHKPYIRNKDHPAPRSVVKHASNEKPNASLVTSVPPDRQKREVNTLCINPTVTRVDECIENMDSQVVEKCMPGLKNMLSDIEETSHGPFVIQTNQSEVCLRQVFGHCSYDSRYRIRTKIKKYIGINMNINFQDEFEMDCCDEESMNEMIENIKDCFQKQKEHIPEFDCNKHNISTEILEVAGRCVDEHTAFTCVLSNQELFRGTIIRILDMLKDESLAILEKVGPEKYTHTRLCLKWIDHTRLENCEPQFFNYVLCLKNGSYDAKLFKKVQQCFADALKVCPEDTVKIIIKILAGAVEGQSGEEPELSDVQYDGNGVYSDYHYAPGNNYRPGHPYLPGNKDHPYIPGSKDHPFGLADDITTMVIPTKDNHCTDEILNEWIQNIKKCLQPRMKYSQDVGSSIEQLYYCVKKVRPSECEFHKFSQFKEILDKINGVINSIPGSNKKDKMDACIREIVSPKLKDCIVKLFLYFVSVHHASHLKESLEEQLAKVKLCFEVTLKNCPFNVIQNLLKTYGAIFRITLGPIFPAQIVTKVTLPEGHLWCETRIVTHEMPPVPTEEIYETPPENEYPEKRTRSTVHPTYIPVPPKLHTEYFPHPLIETVVYQRPSKGYSDYRKPTTSVPFDVDIIEKEQYHTFDYEETMVERYQKTPREMVDFRTPTTVGHERVTWPGKTKEWYRLPPVTHFVHYRPTRISVGQRWTPTTINGVKKKPITDYYTDQEQNPTVTIVRYPFPHDMFSEFVTPTSIERTRFVPPTLPHFRTARPPDIRTIVFRPRDLIFTDVIMPSTIEEEDHRVTPQPVRYSKRPPHIRTPNYTPIEEEWEEWETQSTFNTEVWPVTDYYEYEGRTGTQMNFIIYEIETNSEREEVGFTTDYEIYRPTDKEFSDEIMPTTMDYFTIPFPGEDYEYMTVPKIKPDVFHRTPYDWIWCDIIKPTTVRNVAPPIREHSVKYTRHTPKIETVFYPWKTHSDYEKRTRTEVQTVAYPITGEVYSAEERGTTILLNIFEFQSSVITEKVVPYVTKQVTFTPEIRIWTEKQQKSTIQTTKVPHKIQYITLDRPNVKPYTVLYQPTPGEVERKTRTIINYFSWIITGHPWSKEIFTFIPELVDEICYEGNGESYRGTVSRTISGWKCALWCDHVKPDEYPELVGHNYCRNPTGEESAPWCFSTNPNAEKEICNVPPCARSIVDHITRSTVKIKRKTVQEEMYSEKKLGTTIKYNIIEPQITTRYRAERPHTTAINVIHEGTPFWEVWTPSSVHEEKLTFPEIEEIVTQSLPSTVYKDYICYEGNGESYRGTVSKTISGWECTPWSVHVRPDEYPDLLDHNYCRNPTGEESAPWCFSSNPKARKEICNVPPCQSDYEVFTPSTYKADYYTVPDRSIVVKVTVPKIIVFYLTPKPVPEIFDRQTRTGVGFYSNSVTEETDVDSLRGTTMKMEINEQKPQIYSVSQRLPTTRIVQRSPYVQILTESLAPFTYKTTAIPLPSSVQQTERRIPETTKLRYTVPLVYFTEAIHKTTTDVDTWHVPGFPDVDYISWPGVEDFTFPPFRTTAPIEWKTPTTIRLISHRVTEDCEEDFKKGTTIKIVIEELPVTFTKRTVSPAVPTRTRFPPPPRTYTAYKTPSTVDLYTFTPPSIEEDVSRDQPRTLTNEYLPPEWSNIQWETPTTIQDYYFTPSGHEEITKTFPKTHTIVRKPTKPEYFEEFTQSTTEFFMFEPTDKGYKESMEYPTTRHYSHPHFPITQARHRPKATTKIIHHTIDVPEYTCYIPDKSKKCTTYIRKYKCSMLILLRWKGKIRKCVYAKLKLKGENISDYIKPGKTTELEHIVIDCIKIVGDTPCRNKSFNLVKWMLEKDLTIVGSYGEGAENSNPAEDFSFDVKKCVTLIDDSKLNKCFPGLHQILSDIVLYRKHTVTLQLLKPQPQGCILFALRHCKLPARLALEKILVKIFQKCIKLTGPNEKSICNSESLEDEEESEDSHGECSSKELQKFVIHLKNCMIDIRKTVAAQELMKKFYMCTKMIMPHTCIITNWKTAESVYASLINNLKKLKGDKCTEQLTSDALKCCLQDMISLAPFLEEFDETERAILPVLQCFHSALNSCPLEVISNLLEIVIIVTGLKSIDIPSPDITSQSTISSITVSDSAVDICEHIFNTPPNENMDRPDYEDECLPIYNNQEEEEPSFYFIRSCKNQQVDQWIKQLKNCMDNKVTQIGLQNPEFLTLNRVVNGLKKCVYAQGSIGCRPKYLPDFKKIIKAVLGMIKQNSLSAKQKRCRNNLQMENLSRCISNLHKYLVLTYEPDMQIDNRNKVIDCLESNIFECPCEVLMEFLGILELAIKPDKRNMHSLGELQVCVPHGVPVQPSIDMEYDNNLSKCPDGIRILKKRDLNNLESEEGFYSKGKFSDSKQFEGTEAVQEYGQRNQECSHQDYVHYFQKLTKCRDWRLAFKFSMHNDRCYFSNMKESWIAMIECVVEENDIVLGCNITSRQHLDDFLNHVSEALSSNQHNNDTACAKSAWCYGKHPVNLNKCIDSYQQLLYDQETSPDIFLKIFNITKDVVNCLGSIWPRCPVTVPIMSLPLVYIPLGLNSFIKEEFNFTLCTKSSFGNVPREPQCFHDYSENKLESNHIVKDLEECMVCIKPKDAICFFNNVTDTFEATKEDFLHVQHCLKNYKASDHCIQDVTSKIRDSCLPLFYQCSESIQDGVISKMLESCWRFVRCLKRPHKSCPDEFQGFIPSIYYDILGLNSVFNKYLRKPLLGT